MSRPKNKRVLTPEREAAVLFELKFRWDFCNRTWFERRLQPPILEFSESRSDWSRAERTIYVSRSMLLRVTFQLPMEHLLLAEIDQYVDEGLGLTEEPARGAAVRTHRKRLREYLWLVQGRVELATLRSPEEQRILTRIERLLALAGSQNQHEAEVAMEEAQRLMLKYNLKEPTAAEAESRYGVRRVGPPLRRRTEAHETLASLLEQYFFVQYLWVSARDPFTDPPFDDGYGRTVELELCGTPINLELAAYVYEYLWRVAEHQWAEYRAQEGEGARHEREAFLAGLMSGFRNKLREQRGVAAQEGLVWQGDKALDAFFKERHPYLTYGSARSGASYGSARDAGFSKGRSININRPVEGRGGGTKGLLR